MADQTSQPPPSYTLGFAGKMSSEQRDALNGAFMQLPKEIRDVIGYSGSLFTVSDKADRHHFDPGNPNVIILYGNIPAHKFTEKLINPVVGYGLYRSGRS